MKTIISLLMAFMFCSCASAPWQQVQPDSKILRLNGFSINLGDAEGWHINAGKTSNKVLLVKRNHTTDPFENYAIEAYVVAAPLFKSDEEFLEAVKNGKSIGKDPQYKILKDEIAMHKKQDENCVLSQTVAEQHGKIKSFGFGNPRRPGHMVFESVNLTCRETGNPNNILDLSFSLRYYPNERDPQFDEKAMKIIDSVVISSGK